MEREMRRRRKEFFALCLAAVLVLCSMQPLTAEATEYRKNFNEEGVVRNDVETEDLAEGVHVYPGDRVYIEKNADDSRYTFTIYYAREQTKSYDVTTISGN